MRLLCWFGLHRWVEVARTRQFNLPPPPRKPLPNPKGTLLSLTDLYMECGRCQKREIKLVYDFQPNWVHGGPLPNDVQRSK